MFWSIHSVQKRKERNIQLIIIAICVLLVIFLWKVKISQTESIENIFAKRKILTTEMCRTHSKDAKKTTRDILENRSNNSPEIGLTQLQMQHMFVNHDYKIMFCFVPKAGCTNWKRVMLLLKEGQKAKLVLEIPRSFAHQTKKCIFFNVT